MTSQIRVACAADTRYIPHCAAMMASLARYHPGAFVHFLHDEEVDDAEIERLRLFALKNGLHLETQLVPQSSLTGLPATGRFPLNIWYRVRLPELLPQADRILYLDCDTLVLSSLEALWATNIDGYWLAAVDNVIERRQIDYVKTLGISRYFNSGVLLLNLSQIRTDDLSSKIFDYARRSGSALQWPDQDALNVVAGEGRFPLHPRWNCQSSLYYLDEARETFSTVDIQQATDEPGVVHFEGGGPVKPWHYLSRHPRKKDYLYYRNMTPWKLRRLDGDTLINRIIGLFPERTGWKLLLFKSKVRERVTKLRGFRRQK